MFNLFDILKVGDRMKNYEGETFLDKVYKELHLSEIAMHTADRSDNKYQKIEKYMDRLENVSKRVIEHDKVNLLKKYYYEKYIIKEENVPESYFKAQEKIALDRGYGHLTYDDRTKKEEIKQLINEQKQSLDNWLDYLMSEDTNMYPTWYKYYVFQGMLKLGYFDKAKNNYTKRTSSTVKPFVELNREALALIYSELIKVLNKEEIDDQELERLLNNGSFSKLYAYAIMKLDSVKDDGFKSDEGIWKKYEQGSDPQILFNDINGKGTGWCTAGGIKTATDHLETGDFHVYYTKDKDGNFTKPRIAIRMEYNKIAEIRGIAEDQNIEPNMEKVIDKKLEEFPDKEEYKKKVKDMEMLTYIYTKWQNKGELTKEELRFLYEIDNKIIGFGYRRDPRIEEIIGTRNKRKDLAIIFDCSEENMSLTEEEALRGHIIYHYGDLNLRNLTSAEGLVLPEKINGSLALSNLTSAKGLVLPKEVNGDLHLGGLISAEGLVLSEKINGDLYLSSLTSAEGLVLPTEINCGLDLSGLTTAEGLVLPEKINRSLYLDGLTSAEGLVLPREIHGSLGLDGLTSAAGLVLPKEINGDLYLRRLTSAAGLVLPEKINGGLYLSSLTSAKGLVLPKEINGSLSLSGLTTAEGLVLPEEINGDLNLTSLTSGEGLKFLKEINGNLILNGLTRGEGLVLPEKICGKLDLGRLNTAVGLTLPKEINGSLILNDLTSAEGLVLPKVINGNLYLNGLTRGESLVLPERIKENLYLMSLQNVDNITWPCIVKMIYFEKINCDECENLREQGYPIEMNLSLHMIKIH